MKLYGGHFVLRSLFFSLCVALTAMESVSVPSIMAGEAEKADSPTVTDSGTKLLRFPDLYGDEVVFTYAGDLWKAPLAGGQAWRLTAHPGLELFPKFSPDGKWIAFTSQYDGDEQVYVIPSEGGIPRQLTYYPTPGPNAPRRGYDCQVMGWTPDSRRILFRSGRGSNGVDALTHLYFVSLDGGLPQRLPMPTAGAGDLSPDGKRVVYSPLFRDFRSWKRYQGGWAQYLLIYDLENQEYHSIPTTPRTDRDPMWVGDEVYFVSDRDGTMNLYHYDRNRKTVEQKTDYHDWDLRWASSDGTGRIVYEVGGELKWFDAAAGQETGITITVPTDSLAARPIRIDAGKNLEFFELAPGSKRALFVARGDLFSVPMEKGNVRNLTKTSGVHERCAVWSKDGKRIAFLSDETGEDQVWLIDPFGENKRQITDSMTSMLNDLVWSPDGGKLAVRDAKNNLYALLEKAAPTADVAKSDSAEAKTDAAVKMTSDETLAQEFEVVQVAHNPSGTEFSATWSPSGRYLAFTLETAVNNRTIYVWDSKTRTTHQVTNELFDHFSPTWSPKGDWLFYLGMREFYPQISGVEWNFAGDRMTGIFGVALRGDLPDLFAPESDEAEITEDASDKNEEKTADTEKKSDTAESNGAESKDNETAKMAADGKTGSEKETVNDEIDFDGLRSRVTRVPVESGDYNHLTAAEGFLFYVKSGAPYYGRESYASDKIMAYDLEKKKESVYAEDAGPFTLSPDGKMMIFRQKDFKVGSAVAAPGETKTVSTELWTTIDPKAEWNEIFEEVWRRYRDYFYVDNMHGYDWKGIGDRYRTLLPHVAHRSDLNYILTEMVAELNCGHTYIEGGDFTVPKRPTSGLAGALFELDSASNRYRIAKIYAGQNEEPKYRSPLTEPGIDIAVGDYVLAVDGEELIGTDNPYRLLQNKKNAVTWKIAKSADGSDAREITYKPIENEAKLRYLDFVLERQRRVAEATDGKVGYLHIPDMGAEGAYEFIKWYYPQRQKEGLIIDDRNNGGGNISQWVLMRLGQKVLGTRLGNDRDTAETYPGNACSARMVCLINETSASDGDIFPYYFREAGLGPLIGKRSWGGVVGISSRGPLLDGGTVYVPLSATNSPSGDYIIEGHGVDPDIEVAQDPTLTAVGGDPQLERGIAEVLKRIEADPPVHPQKPADPVKTK